MSIQIEFILSVVVVYLVIVPFAKTLRDIIQFRFQASVFDYAPEWLRIWLVDGNPLAIWKSWDGWHVGDGAAVCVPLILVWYWGNRFLLGWPWKWAIVGYFVTVIGFYVVFNLLFHWVLMRRGFRG